MGGNVPIGGSATRGTTEMAYMAIENKHHHLMLSSFMVVVFLAATVLGSFVILGIVSQPTHRSQGQIELPYSQREVWQALLDVNSRSQIQTNWVLSQVSTRDRNGALQWEAQTKYGKLSQFERVSTQEPSRVVFEEFSPLRNSRTTTEFRLESLGNSRTRVVATQNRETSRWFDRSLLVLYGMNHNMKGVFGYLKTYFDNGS